MQIVLKAKHNSNRPKIPYIVDTNYQKRFCYVRNLNYPKFEEKILEIVKKVCKIYCNKSMLEETYKKAQDKSIDLIKTLKNQIETINTKVININRNLDSIYNDKLNGVLLETDFVRISKKFVIEREKLESEKSALTDRLQLLQGKESLNNKNDIDNMNKAIQKFLEMKDIDKTILYRLIDKIEIDKDKNIFISFNFVPLNTINENMEEFIEIEKVLEVGNYNVG